MAGDPVTLGARQALAAALLDLVIPQECGGCGRRGTFWCAACESAVLGSSRMLDLEVPGAAAGEHSGPLGRAVVAFKDAGQRGLAGPLARALAGSVSLALGELGGRVQPRSGAPVWLVPVPSRPRASRRRGADHMSVLAGRAARELRRSGWPAHRCRLLTHVHDSRDQVGLDRDARRANVAGTLRASVPPAGILVVLDDVTTTGATLSEAVRALRAAVRAGPGEAAGAHTGWPIVAATITVATRGGGHASPLVGH